MVVGLGNPGKKFEKTRHNAGFRVIDEIATNFQFPHFLKKVVFNAEISEGKIGSEKVILAKPQTFMNASGQAVKLLAKRYAVNPKNLIVIHDDIDLPFGKIRISVGHSSAGHKGVESIISELKSKNFVRFRIGINATLYSTPHEIKPEARKQKAERFVLQKFSKDEEKILKEVIEKTVEAIEMVINDNVNKAMAKFN